MDVELSFNGITLGVAPYPISGIEGLWETPDVRTSDVLRARAHGMWPGVDLLGGRSIQATIEVAAGDLNGPVLGALASSLRAATDDESPLLVRVDGLAGGRQLVTNARVRRLALPVDIERYQFGHPQGFVEWWATDPRLYDSNVVTLTTIIGAQSNIGLEFDAEFDVEFGGQIPSGIVTANNLGTFPAPWVANLRGPLTNPRVENITTGQSLRFQGVIGSGETITIESLTRSVTVNGASRYSFLVPSSTWFDLAPGATQLRLAASSGDSTGSLSFRSAWI